MKTLLIILLISFLTFESFSQNDTIQLLENSIIFRGEEINKIINGIKQGKWIDFAIGNDELTISSASGYDANFNDVHWYTMTQKEFRPLKATERDGEILVLSERLDTTYRDRRYHISEVIIHSRVPPDKYNISAKGNYRNDLKTGKWTFYHENGNVRKEIEYSNGLPTNSFKIFRDNGQLMIEVTRLDNSEWKICRYSVAGKLIDCTVKKINEFTDLY